jgi:hypothetical protein
VLIGIHRSGEDDWRLRRAREKGSRQAQSWHRRSALAATSAELFKATAGIDVAIILWERRW